MSKLEASIFYAPLATAIYMLAFGAPYLKGLAILIIVAYTIILGLGIADLILKKEPKI